LSAAYVIALTVHPGSVPPTASQSPLPNVVRSLRGG
jgi:hypothetical protein